MKCQNLKKNVSFPAGLGGVRVDVNREVKIQKTNWGGGGIGHEGGQDGCE